MTKDQENFNEENTANREANIEAAKSLAHANHDAAQVPAPEIDHSELEAKPETTESENPEQVEVSENAAEEAPATEETPSEDTSAPVNQETPTPEVEEAPQTNTES